MKIQSLVFTDEKVEAVQLFPEAIQKLKDAPVYDGKVHAWVQVNDISGKMHVLRAVETKGK